MLDKKKVTFHLIYGIVLFFVGIMTLIRIPETMPKLVGLLPPSGLTFGRFCLYLIGILLVAGGAKKIIINYRLLKAEQSEQHG